MFSATEAFSKQFVPHEDGYVYYGSHKRAGKFVSKAEYDALVEQWEKVAGRRGQWKFAGITIVLIILWTVASDTLRLPELYGQLALCAIVAGVVVRYLWASFSPRRLVSSREALLPPRSKSQARRDTRALLDWRLIVLSLLLSGGALFDNLTALEWTTTVWAWIIGSGSMLGLYIWVAVRKLGDHFRS